MGESIVNKDLQNQESHQNKSVYLHRVRIPDFRVLKDIDITFEKDLSPSIFPLGSLNGGGKSTLLQLVFILLSCILDEENFPFLQNMISGFKMGEVLAEIELIIENESTSLEFFSEYKKLPVNIYTIPPRGDKSIFNICCYDTCDTHEGELLYKVNLLSLTALDQQLIRKYLKKASEHIFLAAPITQSFRFINKSIRELAFKTNLAGEYYQGFEESRRNIKGFFSL
jgi:hypothetical protein